jgi:hypothetical protein
MEEMMKMNFVWPGMTADFFNYVWQRCPECRKFKGQRKNYGDVPVGDPIFTPWEVVVGPCTIPVNCQIQDAGCGVFETVMHQNCSS